MIWRRAFGLSLALACAANLAAAEITSARYSGPTDRYPHGVLGDDIEHTTLEVTLASGKSTGVTWASEVVFEDTAPRLADLDGDGAPEVIAVESHDRFGARLSVYGLTGDTLALRAATPFIGTRFRWLAVVDAADLDGDGSTEIAYVDRPHLAKTLRIWTYASDGTTASLTPRANLAGVTNHRIGEEDIAGGIRTCGNAPEMILATANWQRLVAITFDGIRLTSRDIGSHRNRSSFAAAMDC
ncbi:FG-GAP repeat domain-containing protein [Pseudaestuariivita sp.]|uniref:FG-GAP repeat domain-containing protein n=1 Tax=Pseudaestuariivita sp. TaxID=2211669 RepID=UPI00405990D7